MADDELTADPGPTAAADAPDAVDTPADPAPPATGDTPPDPSAPAVTSALTTTGDDPPDPADPAVPPSTDLTLTGDPPSPAPLAPLPTALHLHSSTAPTTAPAGHALPAKSPLDLLISSHHSGSLHLTATPIDATPHLIPLAPEDDWAYWLSSIDSDDATFALSVSAADAAPVVHGFEVTLHRLGVPLVFSSAPSALTAALGAAPDAGLLTDPASPTRRILACGLIPPAASTPLVTTVTDLFTYAGLSPRLPSALPPLTATLATAAGGNALWFDPAGSYATTVRLCFTVTGAGLTAFRDLFEAGIAGLHIGALAAVVTRRTVEAATARGRAIADVGGVAFRIGATLRTPRGDIDVAARLELRPRVAELVWELNSPGALAAIVDWLAGLAGVEIGVKEWLTPGKDGAGRVVRDAHLHRVTLSLAFGESEVRVVGARLEIEVATGLGCGGDGSGDDKDKTTLFLLTFGWRREGGSYFHGRLWPDPTAPPAPGDHTRLLPTYDPWAQLVPKTTGALNTVLSLPRLIPGHEISNVPAAIPQDLSELSLSLDSAGIGISATIVPHAAPPADDDDAGAPGFRFDAISLVARYDWGAQGNLQLGVQVRASLPAEGMLVGVVEYERRTKRWRLVGQIEGVGMKCLEGCFDRETRQHVEPILGGVRVERLRVEYDYVGGEGDGEKAIGGDTDGKKAIEGGKAEAADETALVTTTESSETASDDATGSTFDITGTITISALSLSLLFHHSAAGWTFKASLKALSGTATIGDILSALSGQTPSALGLPSLVADTPFAATSGADAFSFTLAKHPDTKTLQLHASIAIGPGTLAFGQLRRLAWPAATPSKRFVKAALQMARDPKEGVLTVPLVGEFRQPLDGLVFLWVQDATETAKSGPGLTRQDVADVKECAGVEVPFKELFKDPGTPEDVVLPAGAHIVVVVVNPSVTMAAAGGDTKMVLVDYVFMKPDAKGKALTAPTPETPAVSPDADDVDPAPPKALETDTGDTARAPFKKKTGALAISNIGVSYASKTVTITFDATFELGPVGLSLLGFALGLQFDSLHAAPQISVDLEGLAASFDRPPLLIAGIIRRGHAAGVTYYAGGLVLGFKLYQFEAAGFYGSADDGRAGFNPFFVYARLRGPLVDFGFASIAGITGGMGYQTSIRLPTVETVARFPFVAQKDEAAVEGAEKPSTLATLKALIDPTEGWFAPNEPGAPATYWGAVGLKVEAFKMLAVDAVVVAQFGAGGSGLRLAVLAVAVADIPNAASPVKFAHLELGIACILDVDHGLFKAEAQLSPASYILDPSCHVTGGFALYYWFAGPQADAARAGDWVFTAGGYHQAFLAPAGYPHPPRLAISWQLGSALSIRGTAYFAITPKVCMGGGALRASFHAGPVTAFFDAYADFLVNYAPFAFAAELGVAVGVRYDIDFLFIHTHVSVELTARLRLWGPPLAGSVHVDFWIVGFDIDFGARQRASMPLGLLQFYHLAVQATTAAGAAPRVETDAPAPGEAHTFACVAGLLATADATGAGAERTEASPWVVRGGAFAFLVTCKVAAKTVTAFRAAVADPAAGAAVAGAPHDVHAKPMKRGAPLEESALDVTISGGEAWRAVSHVQHMPSGIWGPYNPSEDPERPGGNHNPTLLDGTTSGAVPLRMGVVVSAPLPGRSNDRLQPSVPEDAALKRIPAEMPLPVGGYADTRWNPEAPAEEGERELTAEEVEKRVVELVARARERKEKTKEELEEENKRELAEAEEKRKREEGERVEAWEGVRDAWAANGATKGQELVNRWQAAMGWGTGLKAAMPERLKKRFLESYVALPVMMKMEVPLIIDFVALLVGLRGDQIDSKLFVSLRRRENSDLDFGLIDRSGALSVAV
ncbi:hypothetical protein EDC01DRAFT_761429 [Geopyxis carbonaria]|nr:hypothetical protein EDC01DRAFT_761429 [Geopyxis carbonaria]